MDRIAIGTLAMLGSVVGVLTFGPAVTWPLAQHLEVDAPELLR